MTGNRETIVLVFMLSTTGMTKERQILFTQDQARTLAGVSVETVRHWRKIIPYISARAGKAARFSFSDVVGLAITQELVKTFGVHIATLSTGVDAMFRLLARTPSLDDVVVLITAEEAFLHKAQNELPSAPVLVIPLAPLVSEIQRHMFPPAIPTQEAFQFLPESLRERA
jgi:hypothetical protein